MSMQPRPHCQPGQQPPPPQLVMAAGWQPTPGVTAMPAVPPGAAGQPLIIQATPGQPSMAAGQQPITIVPQTTQTVNKNKQKGMLVLGVLQIVLGLLLIFVNIVGIGYSASITTISGPGIWNGIIVIIAGALGIVSSEKLTRGYVIAFLVISIIAAVFMTIVIGLAATGVAVDASDDYSTTSWMQGQVASNSILLILAFIECVIAIVASAISCGALYCDSPAPMQAAYQQNGQIVYVNPSQYQQMVVVPTGQPQLQQGYAQPGSYAGPAAPPSYSPATEEMGKSRPPPENPDYPDSPPYSTN